MRCLLRIALAWSLLTFSLCRADEAVHFETHVRSIFKAHCFHCHGEEEKHEGGLDLRLARTAAKGGESGAAIQPGQPEASLLLKRIASGEMPPGEKKLSPQEQNTIRLWISQGARTVRPEPEAVPAETRWTEEERSLWSLQPVVRPALPPSAGPQADGHNAIDVFIRGKREAANAPAAPPADRRTLARRLHFDLLGLPPPLAVVEDFLADESPDAYERLADQLLASPHYGERWARHWLDIAGYADSDGYTEQDPERPWAFRYRDYVIRALNADKPFDRFLVEQLAGDELLPPPYQNLTPEQIDVLTATGFLRMAPDGTAAGGAEVMTARNDVVAETLKIVSSSLLGMTVGCAQCHNHRYDPISQVDYYRFRAIFEPALNVQQWRVPAGRLVNLWQQAQHDQAKQVEAEIAEINKQRGEALKQIVEDIFEKELAKLDPEWQGAARLARETPAKQRTPLEQQILKDYPSLNVNNGSAILYDRKGVAAHNKKYDDLLAAARGKKPAEDFVACLTEVPGTIPVTKVFYRGDIQQPRQAVEPGELSVLGEMAGRIPTKDETLPTTGRRLAFARHLTSGQHPLLGRVLVNRFWMHHFGRGIVATPADFGVLGEKPSHPELLDWLASEFTTGPAQPWSLKRLHRLMLDSATYRQSSIVSGSEPNPEHFARAPVRRLEAEAIRDAILEVSGARSDKMFGPAITVLPNEVGQNAVGKGVRDGNGILIGKSDALGEDEFRRSIYVQVRRSLPLGVLEPFDAAAMSPNCERRTSSTVASQSLLLMNSDFILKQAEHFARRIESEAGNELPAQIAYAWRLAFTREPTEADLAAATAFMTSEQALFEARAAETPAASKPADKKPADKKPSVAPQTQALALWCQALLCSNGFLYVD
jgi:hypothetical protein